MSDELMPVELRGVVPEVGSVWEWEPLNSRCRDLVRVTDVKWNGDECWIESESMIRNIYLNPDPNKDRCWNTLGRWVQAAVLVDVDEAHVRPLNSETWPA